MAIVPEALLGHSFDQIEQSYEARDAILYALGLGLGVDPLNEDDLDYLLETRLKVLPTFAATLASPGMWISDPAFGIDFKRLVHSEQDVIFHRPLPVAGRISATPRVASLADRGEGKGAVLVVERTVQDEGRQPVATVRQTLLLRGDGGFGGQPVEKGPDLSPPERAPDHRFDVATSPRAALIYRLSGDRNPLHADPAFARAAGFERPILHGLASYGIAGHAVMRATKRDLRQLACRFAGVVLPGDTMTFHMWEETDGRVLFEAHVRDRRVLDRGLAVTKEA